MAIGDIYAQGITSVAASGYFSIQPPDGVEIVIHNINHSTDSILEYFDGTNFIQIDTQIGSGGWMGMFLHCTHDKYYRVQNISGGVNFISCDGVVTKEIL